MTFIEEINVYLDEKKKIAEAALQSMSPDNGLMVFYLRGYIEFMNAVRRVAHEGTLSVSHVDAQLEVVQEWVKTDVQQYRSRAFGVLDFYTELRGVVETITADKFIEEDIFEEFENMKCTIDNMIDATKVANKIGERPSMSDPELIVLINRVSSALNDLEEQINNTY